MSLGSIFKIEVPFELGETPFYQKIFLCKGLYGFLLVKIFFIWPVLTEIAGSGISAIDSPTGALVFAPLVLAKVDLVIFLICFILLLLIGLVSPINYLVAFFVFWFSVSLSRLSFYMMNGADMILNLFLMIAITFPLKPTVRGFWRGQLVISNAGLLLAQIQLALIYLLSGYDKLTSEAWRTGAAINSVLKLKFFQNPHIIFELPESVCLLLAWLVIIFEIGFALFIWFERYRILILSVGLLFHLGIGLFLGLVDFALVMIICYCVFLPATKSKASIKNDLFQL